MVKLVVVAHARPGLDPVDALRYWKEVHASFTAKVPGVKRYVQNHCIEAPGREGLGAGASPFLGVGELWFETREDAERALKTPEFEAAMADAGNFLDMERLAAAWAEEHQIPIIQ